MWACALVCTCACKPEVSLRCHSSGAIHVGFCCFFEMGSHWPRVCLARIHLSARSQKLYTQFPHSGSGSGSGCSCPYLTFCQLSSLPVPCHHGTVIAMCRDYFCSFPSPHLPGGGIPPHLQLVPSLQLPRPLLPCNTLTYSVSLLTLFLLLSWSPDSSKINHHILLNVFIFFTLETGSDRVILVDQELTV